MQNDLTLNVLSQLENFESRERFDWEIPGVALELQQTYPTEIFHYTKVGEKLFFEDDSGLKKLQFPLNAVVPPQQPTKKLPYKRKSNKQRVKRTNPYADIIGTDLSKGYEKYRPKSTLEIFKLDDAFRSVQHALTTNQLKLKDMKVITLRRVLTLLMELPINLKDIRFNVIYWKGLIILDYDWEYVSSNSSLVNKYQYSGFRFEQVLTKNTNPLEFYTFVNVNVDGIPLHFTAEIDSAKDDDGISGLESYVEIKTHMQSNSKLTNDNLSLKIKLLKALCQIGFINCTDCIFGFRAQNCQLKAVNTYTKDFIEEFLESNPLFLDDDVSLSHTILQKFFGCIIHYILAKEPKLPSADYEVHKLCFENGESLQQSTIKLEKVSNKQESSKIFSETVPTSFRAFLGSHIK